MLYSKKNKDNTISLLCADFAHSMMSVKVQTRLCASPFQYYWFPPHLPAPCPPIDSQWPGARELRTPRFPMGRTLLTQHSHLLQSLVE